MLPTEKNEEKENVEEGNAQITLPQIYDAEKGLEEKGEEKENEDNAQITLPQIYNAEKGLEEKGEEKENEDYDPSGNIRANPIEVKETPDEEEKDQVSNVLPSSQRNIDDNKNLISTKSNYNEINEETPVQTLTNFDKTNYLNCIDFEEKENILNSLKESDPLVPNYIENTFEPFKDMNEVLILIQKGIVSFYNTKKQKMKMSSIN